MDNEKEDGYSSMNQSLLSNDSIERIRQYVRYKFPHLPKEKHAEIVADALAKVVANQLPSFQSHTKKAITELIIKHIVINQKRPLYMNDIVQACDSYPLSNDERHLYTQWRNAQHLDIKQQKEIVAPNMKKEAAPLNEEVAATYSDIPQAKERKNIKQQTIYTIAFILLFSVILIGHQLFSVNRTVEDVQAAQETVTDPYEEIIHNELPSNELPELFQFTSFDKDIIISYLNTRDSLLVEEPYFSVIYNTAYEFNIHPVLLFAITGQEQGFVPRQHEYAHKIVQNPFNVFYSWQDYNTNIEDTTAIAARTIVNLSKDRPQDIPALKWINRKYAEDEKWHEGVNSLFNSIVNHIIE